MNPQRIQLARDARKAVRTAAATMLASNTDEGIDHLIDEVMRIVATRYHYRLGPVCPACFVRTHKRSKVMQVLLRPDEHDDQTILKAIRRAPNIRDAGLIVDLMSGVCCRRDLENPTRWSQHHRAALTVLADHQYDITARHLVTSAANFGRDPKTRAHALHILERTGQPAAVRQALELHPGLRRHQTRDWPPVHDDQAWSLLCKQERWPRRPEGEPVRSRDTLSAAKCATCPTRTTTERFGHDWGKKRRPTTTEEPA